MKIIICGLPGTGKTTLSKEICKKNNYNYVSDFDIIKEEQSLSLLNKFLLKNDNFVLDIDYRNYNEDLLFNSQQEVKIIYLVYGEKVTLDMLNLVFKGSKEKSELQEYLMLSSKYRELCLNNNLTMYEIGKNREEVLQQILEKEI